MTQLDSKIIVTAQKYLSKADPVMKQLIKRSTPFAMKPAPLQSPFEALTRAIASQQLHGAAATAILGRFIALVPKPKPKEILVHGEKWRPYRTVASWYLWRAAL